MRCVPKYVFLQSDIFIDFIREYNNFRKFFSKDSKASKSVGLESFQLDYGLLMIITLFAEQAFF
jgi:hypothetical protein